MACEFISSQSFQINADTGTLSLTVPADCTFLLVAFGGWDSDDLFPPTTLTINSVAVTAIQSEIADDKEKGYIGRLANPATGSRTLSYNFVGSGAPSEGVLCEVAYFKGVDTTSPVIGSGKSYTHNASAAAAVSSLGTATGADMVVGWTASFDAVATATGNSQTAMATPAVYRQAGLRGGFRLGANAYWSQGGDSSGFNLNLAVLLRSAAVAAKPRFHAQIIG